MIVTVTFHFTPGCEPNCENIILFYDGEECVPPDIEEVFVFAGNDNALDLLA